MKRILKCTEHVQNILPIGPILSQMNPVPISTSTPFLFKVHFRIILPYMPSLLTGKIPHNITLFKVKGC
jgi:hypothetical protein